MKLAKGHIGKRKTIIQFNIPLPEEERAILEEAFFKIVENLKLEPEEVEFTKTKPYKNQPKKKKKEKTEDLKKNEIIEIDFDEIFTPIKVDNEIFG